MLDDNVDLNIVSRLLAIDKTSVATHLPGVIASIKSPKLIIPAIGRSILFNMTPNLDLIGQWCKNTLSIDSIYIQRILKVLILIV